VSRLGCVYVDTDLATWASDVPGQGENALTTTKTQLGALKGGFLRRRSFLCRERADKKTKLKGPKGVSEGKDTLETIKRWCKVSSGKRGEQGNEVSLP